MPLACVERDTLSIWVTFAARTAAAINDTVICTGMAPVAVSR